MGFKKLHLLSIGILVGIIASCSIKEDRSNCPCWLTVDYSKFCGFADSVTVFGWNVDGVCYSDTCFFEADSTGKCVHDVKKGPMISTVLAGLENTMRFDDRLTIPTGHDFDPLYAFSERVECNGEEALSLAIPQKHYARILLNIEGGAENSPYYFIVQSDVAGISLLNMMPYQGMFHYELYPTTDELCYIDIPRQFADSDALVLYAVIDGEIKVTIELAKYLRENSDYNWNASDLADIPVNFNYSELYPNFTVDSWTEGDSFEIIY